MKKKSKKFAMAVLTVLVSTQIQTTAICAEDPSYSTVDNIYFSDPGVNCNELINSEECEIFQASASYSLREGISYADCTVACNEMIEGDACFSYRQAHPCTNSAASQALISIN